MKEALVFGVGLLLMAYAIKFYGAPALIQHLKMGSMMLFS